MILKETFEVRELYYKTSSSFYGKIYNIIISFIKAFWIVPKVDFVYSYFAGFHCFFPVFFAKLLYKKSVIQVGGYDATSIPSLNYGVFYRKNLLQWCIRAEFAWVSKICLVDKSQIKSINYYADPSGKGFPTGVLNFMKLDENKLHVVPNGFDFEFWKCHESKVVKEGVISVAYISNENTFVAKGFDFLIELAEEMPEISFTLCGLDENIRQSLNKLALKNVVTLPFLSKEELKIQYSNHKVFILLSLTEGLPNALCEAMLCECIPIGSAVNGIPYVIGDTGFLLESKSKELMKLYISNALNSDKILGRKARERILHLFPLTKRRKNLNNIFS